MQNPSTLIDSLVTALRAIPELVALLEGNANNVVAYKRTYPASLQLEQAIHELNPPAVMVAHLRTIFGRNIEHQFVFVLRSKGSPDEMFTAIRESVPTGYGGVKFKRAQVQPEVGVPLLQQYSPRSLLIGEATVIEVYEIVLSLFERGADV